MCQGFYADWTEEKAGRVTERVTQRALTTTHAILWQRRINGIEGSLHFFFLSLIEFERTPREHAWDMNKRYVAEKGGNGQSFWDCATFKDSW
jgi:hypothetical protein